MPRFSVVVPAYNAEITLAETLTAVLNQESVDWECVVVDDGSTDSTPEIARSFESRDARFRLLHQDNQGTAGAYNAGVSAALGDFIVMCSADDILLAEHLACMSRFIDSEPSYDIYSSNGFWWVPGESKTIVYDAERRGTKTSLPLSEVIMWCFYSVGAAYRRELFARVGGYRRGVFGEDYDFWLRAMALGARHTYTPQPLSLHRKSEAQKSADIERAYRSDIRIVSDLRRDFDLSPTDKAAVEQCIRTRELLIARLRGEPDPVPQEDQPVVPVRSVRAAIGGVINRVFGEHFTRSISRVLNRSNGKSARR